MRSDRLIELADFLESDKIKDEWFHLSTWAENGFTEKRCGTTACALGWATVCFPDSGLRLEEGVIEMIPVYEVDGIQYTSFDAAAKFFEFEYADAHYLFGLEYGGSPTRFEVADRIREFVADGGRP